MPIIIEDKNKPSKGSDTSDTIDLTSAIASATEQEIQDTSDTIPTIPKPKDDSAWSPPAGTTYPWEQPEKPSYPTYSITDFTNKPEVQEAALGMMEYLDDKKYSNGKNAADDFIDYARYSDWNLGASMKRTVELALKDVDDKRSAKFLQNYSYLLNEFNSQNQDGSFVYENKGLKENTTLAGDILWGVGTDIINWGALFFTAGTSLPAKIVTQQAASRSLRQAIKNMAIKSYNTTASTKVGSKTIEALNKIPKIPFDPRSYKKSMSILGVEGGVYATLDADLLQRRYRRIGVEGYEEYDLSLTAYSGIIGISLGNLTAAGITKYTKYKDTKIKTDKSKKESEDFKRTILDEPDPNAKAPKIISVEEAAELNRKERERNNLPHPSHVEDVADFERRAANEDDLLSENIVNRIVDDEGIIITDETINKAKIKLSAEGEEYVRVPPKLGGISKWYDEGGKALGIPVGRIFQKPTTYGKQTAQVSKELEDEGLVEFAGTYYNILRYLRNDAVESFTDDPLKIAYDSVYLRKSFSQEISYLAGKWVDELETLKNNIQQLAKKEDRYTVKKIKNKLPFTTKDWKLKDGSLLNDDLYLFLNEGRFRVGVSDNIIREAAKFRKLFEKIEREATQTGFVFHKVPNFFPRQLKAYNVLRGLDGETRYAQQLIDDGEVIEKANEDIFTTARELVREQVNSISDHMNPTVNSIGQRKYKNLKTYAIKDLFETDVYTQTWLYANSIARKIVIKRDLGFGETELNNRIFVPIFGGDLTKTTKQEGLDLVTDHLIARGFNQDFVKDEALQKYIKANFLARQEDDTKILKPKKDSDGNFMLDEKGKQIMEEVSIPLNDFIKTNARLRSNNSIINNSFKFKNFTVEERQALLGNSLQEEIDKIITNNFNSETFTRKTRKEVRGELSTKNVNWLGTKRKPSEEKERLNTLIGSMTGVWGRGTKRQEALTGALLAAQAGNKLGLATISSLPELFIPVFKASPKIAMQAFTNTFAEEGFRAASNLFQGTKGIPSLTRKEMNQHNKMISSALSEAINAQYGDGVTGLSSKFLYRFYRTVWLDQYTKFVQIYSYNAGKLLIRETLDNLDKMGSEAYNKNNSRATRLRLKINQLGVNVDEGLKWHKAGGDKKDIFYDQLKSSADRFVDEVVMVPNRENAQKFLASSHWGGRVAFQLYSYPVAFTNTILRNAARDVAMTRGEALPRTIMGFGLMYYATSFTQGLKTRGRSDERDGWNKFLDVINTIGLLGPVSLVYNLAESMEYGNTMPRSTLKLMGPTLGSLVLDSIRNQETPYTSGLIKNTLPYRNLVKSASPKTMHEVDEFLKNLERKYIKGYGEGYRSLKRFEADLKFEMEQVFGPEMREIEKQKKEMGEEKKELATGGLVSKKYPVPFVKDNPTERKIDNTNQSFAVVSGLFEEEDRAPLSLGGKLANKIIRTNLFKKKAGWKWTKAPKGFDKNPGPDFPIVSVETGGKHFYSLQADFPEGVLLERYAKQKSEPRLRPTTKGVVRTGNKIGEIRTSSGKLHPVYDNIVAVDEKTKAVKGLKDMPTDVMPAPQRFFDPEDKGYKPFLSEFDYEEGGRYVELSEKGNKDITGVIPKQARISISPEGKASFTISKEFYESLFAEPITKSRKKKSSPTRQKFYAGTKRGVENPMSNVGSRLEDKDVWNLTTQIKHSITPNNNLSEEEVSNFKKYYIMPTAPVETRKPFPVDEKKFMPEVERVLREKQKNMPSSTWRNDKTLVALSTAAIGDLLYSGENSRYNEEFSKHGAKSFDNPTAIKELARHMKKEIDRTKEGWNETKAADQLQKLLGLRK